MQDWNGPAFTGHIVERAGVHDFSRDFSQGDDGERKGSASGQGRADRLNGNEDKIGADVDTFVREAQDEVSIMCVCVWGGGRVCSNQPRMLSGSIQTRVRACPETRPPLGNLVSRSRV